MKKFLSSLTACFLLFTACKKSQDTVPETLKTPVTFNVSDFIVTQGVSGNADASVLAVGDTLKNYANNLYYRIYDSSGALVKSKSQVSTDAGFGTVTDTLSAGQYTVVFVASKQALSFANTSLATDNFVDASNTHWDDMFLKKLNLTVSASPVHQTVRLDRIVSGLQLNLEEDPYGYFPVVKITLDSEDSTYQLNSQSSSGPVVKSRQWTVLFGSNTKSLFMPVLNTNRPVKVTINIYDRANHLVGEKVVENVRFYANKKTVLTGRLTQDVDFNVSVDPKWYPTDVRF